jgi:DNA repair exonuclease SbcCD ATPase subunit
MNMTEAFKQLNKILQESTASDEYSQVLQDMDQLDHEIKELQRHKEQSWNKKRSETAKAEAEELSKLRKELSALSDTYTNWRRVTTYDGDVDWDFDIDYEKQKAVAKQEAELKNKLKELETRYNEILASVKAEHEASFADTTRDITDKTSAFKAKKARKEEIFNRVKEEERAELDELLKKITAQLPVAADSSNISLFKGHLILGLHSKTFTFDIDYELIDFSNDTASIDTNKVEEQLKNSTEGEDFWGDIADSLEIDYKNIQSAAEGDLLDIPGSTWKLAYDFDVDYDEPEVHSYRSGDATYWEPAWDDIDYDETINWTATCYLMKKF